MRLSDEAAEKLAREWCEKRGKRPYHNVSRQRWEWWIDPMATRDDLQCHAIEVPNIRHGDGYASEYGAFVTLGHSLHECWLACGGEERVAEAVAAEREPDWKVLARLSIDRPADFMILAIKQHRMETGSYLPEAKAAIDAIRKGESQ